MRLFQTLLYALAFGCSGVALGIYSYFLAVLADRDANIPRWEKAVTGLAGAAVLYTIFAVVLTCCLGGISAFAFLAIVSLLACCTIAPKTDIGVGAGSLLRWRDDCDRRHDEARCF